LRQQAGGICTTPEEHPAPPSTFRTTSARLRCKGSCLGELPHTTKVCIGTVGRLGRQTVDRLGRRAYRFPWVEEAGPSLEHIRSEKFGAMPAPESLSEFAQLLEYFFTSGEGILGWRGQRDASWELDSSAVRRQKEQLPVFDGPGASRESQILDYEQKLLDEARAFGHGFRGGRRLSDLELSRYCSTTAPPQGFWTSRGTRSWHSGSRRVPSHMAAGS
jgi:hypothetical protein